MVGTGSFFVGTSLGHGSATISGMTFNNIDFLGTFNLGGSSVVPYFGCSLSTDYTDYTD